MSEGPGTFRRRPPSLLRQVGWGVWTHAALAPAVWGLERLGLARATCSALLSRRHAAWLARDPLAGYAPGEEDVFVATYPKSGTNWMLQIALQLAWHGAARFDHVHDLVPWPDAHLMPLHDAGSAVPLAEAVAWRDAPEPLRVIKTHLLPRHLPLASPARFLGVIRDPKDVFVSSYHFVRDSFLGPAMPSVETWFRLFLQGKTFGGHWIHYAVDLWAARRRPNVRVFSFKAMKRDLPGTVREVASFLGVRASPQVLDDVCRASSFDAMKGIDEKFRVGRRIPWRREGPMLRRGAQGGSAELLTLERQRELDAFFVAELRRHACDLPYEEFADPA